MLGRLAPLLLVSALFAAPFAREGHASPAASAELLVKQGKASEASGEDLVAIKRYSDAMAIDPSSEAAYLALAGVREKRGELLEAEEILSVGVLRVPTSVDMLRAQGRVLRRRGRWSEAESALRHAAGLEGTTGSPREIAILRERATLERERLAPAAELAVWRRLLAIARQNDDPQLEKEASVQARVLALYVGEIDPVMSGKATHDPLRRTLFSIARRGG
jgi:tetratricopeptide (TPR) repeat protein